MFINRGVVMNEYNNNQLNTYLSERNKNYEIFIQRLSELHLKYDHSFSEYKKRDKHLKWLIMLFSSFTIAFLIMSWLSQLSSDVFYISLALFVGLIVILIIMFTKNNNQYNADKKDYDYSYDKISNYLKEAEKYEALLKEEILQYIVLYKYKDDFSKLDESKRQEFLIVKQEEQLNIIKDDINGELNNREILNYFLNWQSKINETNSRDFRKERIDYLNRLDQEKEKSKKEEENV